MVLLRNLVLSYLQDNILFQALHIPGFKNSRADYLSRSQVARAKFKEISPEADQYPTQVPESLMPKSWFLLSTALTDGTRRSYLRAWVVFRQFYAHFYGSTTPPLPLIPTCIPLFISYLSFRKLAFSTITSYLAAISYVHKLRGFRDPTKSFLIQKLLTALSRQRSVDVRLPVTRPVLHKLIQSLSFTNSSAFQRSLFSAMYLVAFYGLFGLGELAIKSTRLASSVVQFNDLTFLSRKGHPHMAKITISVYEHNSNNRPFDILLAAEESQPYCPVTALIQYCKVRDDLPGPLFCHADYSPISVYQFNSELQRAGHQSIQKP